jgi:hypothetical protein
MPAQAPASPAPNPDKSVAPTTTLSPSRLVAVVEARYILEVRSR